MLFKYSSVAIAIATLSFSSLSYSDSFDDNYSSNYYLEQDKTIWDRLMDLGNSWVRKQGKKSENAESIVYAGKSPDLAAWRTGTRNWEPAACLSSDADNSGVWVNHAREVQRKDETFSSYYDQPEKNSSFKTYFISAGTPYEIESKNYKRAGIKRFANYYYSYRIDVESWGIFSDYTKPSTVIDNKKSHDYHAAHTFTQGTSWVHSTTFSDFEWSIGVKNKTSDFNYLESWGEPSNYSIRGSWGGDIYLSDCGFAKVISEPNTKPVINNFETDIRYTDIDGQGINWIGSFFVNAADVEDYHTSDNNLTYTWTVVRESGKVNTVYGKNQAAFWEWVGPQGIVDKAKKVTLIVSDGDMSTVAVKNF